MHYVLVVCAIVRPIRRVHGVLESFVGFQYVQLELFSRPLRHVNACVVAPVHGEIVATGYGIADSDSFVLFHFRQCFLANHERPNVYDRLVRRVVMKARGSVRV